jgi:hypothetical protein
MDNFNLKKYLAEGKLLNEEIKFIDYLTVDQDEFKPLYDKHYDDDGHMEDFEEDFIEDFGIDFLSPNIKKIEKYYGYRVSEEDVIEGFLRAMRDLEFISSNERFEKWLDKSREFFVAEGKLRENDKNDYANSEEDYTDEMVIEKIKDIIKYHELDASDVMEEIGQEFGVAFEFGRG